MQQNDSIADGLGETLYSAYTPDNSVWKPYYQNHTVRAQPHSHHTRRPPAAHALRSSCGRAFGSLS